jgi:hypothetical protein
VGCLDKPPSLDKLPIHSIRVVVAGKTN